MIHDYIYYPVAKRFQDKKTNEMTNRLTMVELGNSLRNLKEFGSRETVKEIIKQMVKEGLIEEHKTVTTYTWRT